MKMADSMADFVLSKLNVVDLVQGWFPEYVADSMVKCPHHDDANASLHISPEGKALCHGCGWKACNVIDLYAKMNGITYTEARRTLYGCVIHAVPDSKVVAFRECYAKNGGGAQYYVAKRGIEERVATEFRLGYDPNTKRVAIPIFDQFLTCVNMRLMAMRPSKHKAINMKDHGEVRLYPEWLAKDEDKLLLVEGEWDCLIGRQLGLPAVTWTGGANAWNHDYDWLLKNKNVMVCYDTDDAGNEGGEQATKLLSKLNSNTITFQPPLAIGKDLNDWHQQDFQIERELIATFDDWDPQIQDVSAKVCPCCGRKYD